MTERWLPVVGYESLYEVSDLGRVRSYARSSVPYVLTPTPKSTGYLRLRFSVSGVKTTKPVHKIVAEAFIGPPPEGTEVRHLNDDPSDNRWANLVYDTHSQNMQDKKWNRGPSGTSKLSPQQVREIRALLRAVTQHEIAAHFGICQQTVSDIKCGRYHLDVAT